MSEPTCKILFVCTGNTCRSPMAEGLMRKHVKENPQFQITSAGVAARTGSVASIETRNILLDHGIDFSAFRSQQVTAELIEDSNYVFCMSRIHREAILSSLPVHREKVLRLGEFIGEDSKPDIFDPFGLGEPAYKEVEKQILIALENITAFISDHQETKKDLE